MMKSILTFCLISTCVASTNLLTVEEFNNKLNGIMKGSDSLEGMKTKDDLSMQELHPYYEASKDFVSDWFEKDKYLLSLAIAAGKFGKNTDFFRCLYNMESIFGNHKYKSHEIYNEEGHVKTSTEINNVLTTHYEEPESKNEHIDSLFKIDEDPNESGDEDYAIKITQKTKIKEILNEEIPEIIKDYATHATKNNVKDLTINITKDNNGKVTEINDWIENRTGKTEKELLDEFGTLLKNGNLTPPKPTSVKEIDDLYKKIVKTKETKEPIFHIVNRFNAAHYPEWEESTNTHDHIAIVQLASQFNYLESPNDKVYNVLWYPFDKTQGPIVAQEAATAAIFRTACVLNEKLPHALHNVLPDNIDETVYKNGYLKLYNIEKDKEKVLQEMLSKINEIEVLTQAVICEKTGKTQIQAFTASPSYQSYRDPEDTKKWITPKTPESNITEGKLCIAILEKQYRAIAQMAVLKSMESDKQVNLHLSFVGRGAFNIPDYVEHECLNEVAKIVNGYNVNVFVHDFGGNREWNDNKWKFKTKVHEYPKQYEVQSSYNK